MSRLILTTGILFALCGAEARAAEYFSSHFCQPYKNGGTPAVESYYQNQGSLLAAAESTVSCPLSAASLNGTLQVRLYYSSFGVTAATPISCRLWKISISNASQVGGERQGQPNVASGLIDLLSASGPVNPIGAHIECRLKAGVKILGYYLY